MHLSSEFLSPDPSLYSTVQTRKTKALIPKTPHYTNSFTGWRIYSSSNKDLFTAHLGNNQTCIVVNSCRVNRGYKNHVPSLCNKSFPVFIKNLVHNCVSPITWQDRPLNCVRQLSCLGQNGKFHIPGVFLCCVRMVDDRERFFK